MLGLSSEEPPHRLTITGSGADIEEVVLQMAERTPDVRVVSVNRKRWLLISARSTFELEGRHQALLTFKREVRGKLPLLVTLAPGRKAPNDVCRPGGAAQRSAMSVAQQDRRLDLTSASIRPW